MTDIKDLERLTCFLNTHQLPVEQNLFMNYEQYQETEYVLSKFPAGVVIFKEPMSSKMPRSLTIKYNGYTFNIFQY